MCLIAVHTNWENMNKITNTTTVEIFNIILYANNYPLINIRSIKKESLFTHF